MFNKVLLLGMFMLNISQIIEQNIFAASLEKASINSVATYVAEYKDYHMKTDKWTYSGQILWVCPGGTEPIEADKYYVKTIYDEDTGPVDRYRINYICK